MISKLPIMKSPILPGLLLGILLTSCNEKEFDIHHPNVEQFVSLIKTGNYVNEVSDELPDFTLNDIEQLLTFVEDTVIITQFPNNPISSKKTSPKVLSECIMWTIEGIRLENKYPSLEPSLINTTNVSPAAGYARLNNLQLIEVAHRYINWYSDYKAYPSEEMKKKVLLEDLNYKWN